MSNESFASHTYNLLNMWNFNNKILEDKDIPIDSLGFLYKITHVPTGKWYIGRKMTSKAATKVVNGKKKKIRKENDWRDYWSSSKIILAMIEDEGTKDFRRDILIFVTTKAAMTLGEEYLLHVTGSLFDPLCLNENIRARIFRKWFIKTPNIFKELQAIKI